MERVSRFTQADIVTSIDGLVSKTTLGFCHTFKVHSYKLPDGEMWFILLNSIYAILSVNDYMR